MSPTSEARPPAPEAPAPEPVRLDAAVVGAGFGGSACAGLLAKRGMKVLLVEKNARAGGKAMSLSKNGFTYTAWVVIGAPVIDNLYQAVAKELGPQAAGIRKLLSKQLGLRPLIEAAWKELGLGATLRLFQRHHRLKFPLERLVFGLVWNRLADPKSKLAANDWLKDTVYFPEGEELAVHHHYRALDVLEEHSDELQVRELEALRRKLPAADWKTICTDTTSSYFESSVNDEDRAAIAAEWARHQITVNALAPGYFLSPMNAERFADPDVLRNTIRRIPMQRLATYDDLTPVLIFLASEAAKYITGQVIVVDGGWTIL